MSWTFVNHPTTIVVNKDGNSKEYSKYNLIFKIEGDILWIYYHSNQHQTSAEDYMKVDYHDVVMPAGVTSAEDLLSRLQPLTTRG